MPRILLQQGTNLVNKFALLLHKCRFAQDSRDKPENDGSWRCWLSICCEVLKHLLQVIRGLRPANLDCRITSGNDSRAECITSGNDSRVVQCGRSMIEMLGVLAIIAVLSVGGIAGYSKAMTQFKVNKIIAETNQLITIAHEYTLKDKSFSISPYVSENERMRKPLGLCPESWENCEDSGLGEIDMSEDDIVFRFPEVPELCLAAINNIAIPLKESVKTVYLSSQGPEDEDAVDKCNDKMIEEIGKCRNQCNDKMDDELYKCFDQCSDKMDDYQVEKCQDKCLDKMDDEIRKCRNQCNDKMDDENGKCIQAALGFYHLEIKNNYIGDDGDEYDESSKSGTLDFNDPRLISVVATTCRGKDRFVQIHFKKGVIGN